MDNFFLYLKKFLVLTVFVVFAFVVTYVPHPASNYSTVPEVNAQVAVIDTGNIVQTTATKISAGATAISSGATSVNTAQLFTKEFILDGIAWGLAKSIISSMTASTVKWINSGFEGSPAFIQDLDGFLLNVADEVAGSYLQELGEIGSFLCSPFQLDIQVALALEYQVAREQRPYEGCRVSETFENFESFIEGNFLEGGWEDWFTLTAQPEKYTGYGQKLSAENTFNQRLLRAQNSETEILRFGDGFLSHEVCEAVEGPNAYQERCRIVTPGQTISNSLNKALGSGQDSLIAADEIDEIIGALVGQLAVKAITGAAGLLGLSANTGYTSSGYSSGSYLGDLDAGSGSDNSESLRREVNNIEATIRTNRNFQAATQSYGNQFTVALDRSNLNENTRSKLQLGKDETMEVLLKILSDIPTLQKYVSDYRALESQLNNPNLSQTERLNISRSQQAIIAEFIAGNYYTEADAKAKTSLWKSYLQS